MIDVALFLFAGIGIVNAWLSRQANEIQHKQLQETARLASEMRHLGDAIVKLERSTVARAHSAHSPY